MEVHHQVFYVSLGQMQNNMRSSVTLKLKLKPGFQLNATHATQPMALRACVRCVNENRKQRKHLIGCVDDWLFRSTIPIGWRLRALRLDGNRV